MHVQYRVQFELHEGTVEVHTLQKCIERDALKRELESRNVLSKLFGLELGMSERALALEPPITCIRHDFDVCLSSDLNLDPGLDLDLNLHVNVEMDLANANASAGKVFGDANANGMNRSRSRPSPSSHPSPRARASANLQERIVHGYPLGL